MGDDAYNPSGENLAYDLRQRYAKLVGDHLEIVSMFRQSKDYMGYYTSLEDLYTVIVHKFKGTNKNKKIVKNKYPELKKNCIEVSNKYPYAWGGSANASANEIAKIEEALRSMERYLYFKMDEANLFGSKQDQEHLS